VEGGKFVRPHPGLLQRRRGKNYPDDITPSPLESLPAEVGVGVRFPSPEENQAEFS
jgi:hypothetical protein